MTDAVVVGDNKRKELLKAVTSVKGCKLTRDLLLQLQLQLLRL